MDKFVFKLIFKNVPVLTMFTRAGRGVKSLNLGEGAGTGLPPPTQPSPKKIKGEEDGALPAGMLGVAGEGGGPHCPAWQREEALLASALGAA